MKYILRLEIYIFKLSCVTKHHWGATVHIGCRCGGAGNKGGHKRDLSGKKPGTAHCQIQMASMDPP